MVNYRPIEGLELGLEALYVSRQVLLNDEANQSFFRVQDYYVLNARVAYTLKLLTAFFRVNNFTNSHYETYGVLGGFPTQPNLMPASGINVFGGVTVKFANSY